jgi:hypothetical protein
VPAHEADPDRVLAPSLGYLRDIVAGLPVESDAAFVVMPSTAPIPATTRASIDRRSSTAAIVPSVPGTA